MTPAALHSLSEPEAAALPPPLHALWQDAHGHWDRAHSLVDELETPDAMRVHAYLHRKEGNATNAAYCTTASASPPSPAPSPTSGPPLSPASPPTSSAASPDRVNFCPNLSF